MKKGILFLNGEPPEPHVLESICERRKSGEDFSVFCTDGAYKYVSRVLLPDTVVGDFDSLCRSDVSGNCEVIEFPAEKDFTDGFLAVKIMAERGMESIDLYGAYGGRPDMTESNYMLLALSNKLGANARICGEYNTYFVTDVFSANVKKGAIVSIVPFTDSLHILYTKGLKYPLADYTMTKFDGIESPDYIMGVSNESVGAYVEFKVDGGAALVFIQE